MSWVLGVLSTLAAVTVGWVLSEITNGRNRREQRRQFDAQLEFERQRFERQIEESYRKAIFPERLAKYQDGVNFAREALETVVRHYLPKLDPSTTVDRSQIIEHGKKLQEWFSRNHLWLSDKMREATLDFLFVPDKSPGDQVAFGKVMSNYTRMIDIANEEFGTRVLHRPVLEFTLLEEIKKKGLINDKGNP